MKYITETLKENEVFCGKYLQITQTSTEAEM
jgi:hypothetical protein